MVTDFGAKIKTDVGITGVSLLALDQKGFLGF